MGLIVLIHDHGLVPVILGVVAIKLVKYKLVCWRASSVNKKVTDLCTERLNEEVEDNERDEPQLNGGCKQACVWCKAPLCILQDADEDIVLLGECKCGIHLKCLVDAATRQHGVALPRIPQVKLTLEGVDELLQSVDKVYDALLRFFGVAPVVVDCFECPCCGVRNKSWQAVGPEVLPPDATTHDMAIALARGDPLVAPDLRRALLNSWNPRNPRAPPTLPFAWDQVLDSDCAFQKRLQERGPDACKELVAMMQGLGLAPADESLAAQTFGGLRARTGVKIAAAPAVDAGESGIFAALDPNVQAHHACFIWG